MRTSILASAGLLGLAAAHPSTVRKANEFGCGAEPTAEFMQATAELAAQEAAGNVSSLLATINVPTYVHVVASSTAASDGYITDAQITNQIAVLNSNYAPHGISFTLAGTDRTINPTWATDGNELAMKRALRKGDYKSLNLYFQKSLGGNLGYCYFPASGATSGSTTFIRDGCTILYSTAPGGSATNYNQGKTATHEVGHWFGLYHTFQGQSCSGSGDQISDTPQQLSATSGCPTGRDSCPNAAGLDPIHNYMDYSYDSCYEEFTAGQQTRMYNQYNTYRA